MSEFKIFNILSNIIHSFKEYIFIIIISVSTNRLTNIHSVFMGYNTYCTVRVSHVLGAAELVQFPLYSSVNIILCIHCVLFASFCTYIVTASNLHLQLHVKYSCVNCLKSVFK